MSNLWIALKRNRIYADIYYKGEKICTVNVHDANRSVTSVISFNADSDVTFKIINNTASHSVASEDDFNKEEFNK